jgi:hypothetical protein
MAAWNEAIMPIPAQQFHPVIERVNGQGIVAEFSLYTGTNGY